jgi:acetyltransferase-like isoleucine patch superfamily enzyme
MVRLLLALIQAWDRLRLRRLHARHPGLEIHPTASTNFAVARFDLAPGARLRIGPGVTTERQPGGVRFSIRSGGEVEIGESCWLRSELSTVHLVAYEDARISVGPRCFLNGCLLSSKGQVDVGLGVLVGVGTRVFDADQHPFDADTPERVSPIRIGEDAWLGSDVTVLRGVEVGDHCIVGARSVVTRSIPPHTLAVGAPAQARGSVGDRSAVRVL